MNRKYSKYIIYISLLFLLIVLYKAEYLKIPHIQAPFLFIGSFFFLFLGFIINSISQKKLLLKSDFTINTHHALAMVGLNVFGKYIPGKVWMVMGKAVYLSENLNFSVAALSLLFLNAQIVGLWCGLILGITGLFINDALHLLSWAGLLLLIFISFIMFSKTAHDTAFNLVDKLVGKKLSIPLLSITDTISLLPWFIGGWLSWGIGFFLLASSITDNFIDFSSIFCFPLAGTLGILFIFAPGGIGVREGIMVGYLSILNITLPEAVTISITSRLWFLIGEIFIFTVGYIAHRKQIFLSVNHNKANQD